MQLLIKHPKVYQLQGLWITFGVKGERGAEYVINTYSHVLDYLVIKKNIHLAEARCVASF